jgi:hypothetical protein
MEMRIIEARLMVEEIVIHLPERSCARTGAGAASLRSQARGSQ